MGFFRRIAGILGISKDDADHPDAAAGDSAAGDVPQDKVGAAATAAVAAGHATRRGFSVQVPVTVDRPRPVLVPCPQADGGVQGFRWYTRRLRIDEDGDVADEFLDELVPESLINNDASAVGRFQVKYTTRPTALAMRNQTVAVGGDILHSLEYQGQLRWV